MPCLRSFVKKKQEKNRNGKRAKSQDATESTASAGRSAGVGPVQKSGLGYQGEVGMSEEGGRAEISADKKPQEGWTKQKKYVMQWKAGDRKRKWRNWQTRQT
jgi:hypothetical protein